MYNGNTVDFSAIQDDELIFEGYVTSSDEAGNIYKTLYIQDKPENPTVAIQLTVDVTSLYTFYEVGRKVYVKLNGLGLHENFGVLEIGELSGTSVNRISSSSYQNHIIRSTEISNIIPVEIDNINTLTTDDVGKLVQLNDMQSVIWNETFANIDDTESVNRMFKNCINNETILLRNSGFSDFKAQNIPNGQGSITGILSYFNNYQLYIRDPEDLDLTNNRCGLQCEGLEGKSVELFTADFESYSDISELIDAGWLNINVNGGNETFELSDYANNQYLQGAAYNAGEEVLEMWMVTPPINFDATDNEIISFETKTGYNNGAALSVWVSSDFNGDVTTATWISLDSAIIANGPDNAFEFNFTNSDNVSLSCLSGDVHIGFKYVGGESTITTTFQIDNIKVTGE